MIKNYTEVLVEEIYNEMKSSLNDCKSEKCEHNIKSMALNNLPTSYFDYDSTESDIKAYLLDRQRRITVLAKVAEVSEIICNDCRKNSRRE